jgi:hypothetical protein
VLESADAEPTFDRLLKETALFKQCKYWKHSSIDIREIRSPPRFVNRCLYRKECVSLESNALLWERMLDSKRAQSVVRYGLGRSMLEKENNLDKQRK